MDSKLLKAAHEKIPSVPVLVNLISKRERELINGAKPLINPSTLLTDEDRSKNRSALDLDKCDIALAEVAEEMQISRQGARDIIKKAEEELLFYEEKLGLAKKLKRVEASASQLQQMAKEHSLPKTIEDKIAELVEAVEL